jgi:hypothetical protein
MEEQRNMVDHDQVYGIEKLRRKYLLRYLNTNELITGLRASHVGINKKET